MSYISPYTMQLKQARDAERMAEAERAHQRKMLWESFGANALQGLIGTGLGIGSAYAQDYTASAKKAREATDSSIASQQQARDITGYEHGRKKFDDSINDRARDINAGIYGTEIPGGTLPAAPKLPPLSTPQSAPPPTAADQGGFDATEMRKAALSGMGRGQTKLASPPEGLGASGMIRPPPKMPSAIDLNETLPPSADDKIHALATAKVQAERAAKAEAARQQRVKESIDAADVASKFKSTVKNGKRSVTTTDYRIRDIDGVRNPGQGVSDYIDPVDVAGMVPPAPVGSGAGRVPTSKQVFETAEKGGIQGELRNHPVPEIKQMYLDLELTAARALHDYGRDDPRTVAAWDKVHAMDEAYARSRGVYKKDVAGPAADADLQRKLELQEKDAAGKYAQLVAKLHSSSLTAQARIQTEAEIARLNRESRERVAAANERGIMLRALVGTNYQNDGTDMLGRPIRKGSTRSLPEQPDVDRAMSLAGQAAPAAPSQPQPSASIISDEEAKSIGMKIESKTPITRQEKDSYDAWRAAKGY